MDRRMRLIRLYRLWPFPQSHDGFDGLSDAAGQAAGAFFAMLAFLLLVLLIVMVVITVVVAVKLLHLVIRVYVRYGKVCRGLWLWFFTWLGLLVATGASATLATRTVPPDHAALTLTGEFALAWLLVTLGLVVYCRVVEARFDQFYPVPAQPGLRGLVARPWWPAIGQ